MPGLAQPRRDLRLRPGGDHDGYGADQQLAARRTTYWFKVRAVDAAGNVGPFGPTVSTRTT
jgi:hypothetical protein